MILTRSYLKGLVRQGRAKREGVATHNHREYVIVTRYDIQRTDHYLACATDFAELSVHLIAHDL